MNERDAEGAIFAASFQLLYTADEAALILRVPPSDAASTKGLQLAQAR
jgi:hypothetical protein